MLVNSSIGLTQQYQSIYVTLLGATSIQLGYLASIGGIANILLSIPIGVLADRQGIKKMVLASLLFYIIGFSIFGFALSWELTAFGFLFTSVAMLIANNVCPMICGACLAGSERTTGMQLCDTVAAIPRLFAPIASALVISYLGGLKIEAIKPLYFLGASGIFVALLVMARLFENPTIPKSTEKRNIRRDFLRIFQEGVNVKRWLIYYTLMTIPWYISFYIPLYAKQVKGASTIMLGFMDSGYWLAVVLLALPVGIAADKFGRKKIIMTLIPLYCLGLLILGISNNDLALLVSGILNGFVMLAAVTEYSITVELVPRELLGSWLGIIGFAMGITSFITPIISGYLWWINPVYVLFFIVLTQITKLGILAGMPSKTKYS